MKQKSGPGKAPAEQVLKDIRRGSRTAGYRQFENPQPDQVAKVFQARSLQKKYLGILKAFESA